LSLKRLTKPLDGAPADEGAAELQEGQMNVVGTLVAHLQTARTVEPAQCAFRHPAITAQPLAGLDAPAGDTRDDVAASEGGAQGATVVGLVRMQLVRALPRRSLRGRERWLPPIRSSKSSSRLSCWASCLVSVFLVKLDITQSAKSECKQPRVGAPGVCSGETMPRRCCRAGWLIPS
jgi:hypothetical protein